MGGLGEVLEWEGVKKKKESFPLTVYILVEGETKTKNPDSFYFYSKQGLIQCVFIPNPWAHGDVAFKSFRSSTI